MGNLYDITCEKCPAVTSVYEGYGFQNAHATFEYLFLNILTKTERKTLSEILPEGFDSGVSRVTWSQEAFTCTHCSKLENTTHWSITLAGGTTYERELVCLCGGEQVPISLHSEAEIDANCPACGAHGLSATPSGMWD